MCLVSLCEHLVLVMSTHFGNPHGQERGVWHSWVAGWGHLSMCSVSAWLFLTYLQGLNSNGSGHLVGESATIADVALLELVLFVQDYFGDAALESYTGIQVGVLVTL